MNVKNMWEIFFLLVALSNPYYKCRFLKKTKGIFFHLEIFFSSWHFFLRNSVQSLKKIFYFIVMNVEIAHRSLFKMFLVKVEIKYIFLTFSSSSVRST